MDTTDSRSFPIGRNRAAYYAYHLFLNLSFWLPVYAVFFLNKDLNYQLILILYALVNGFQTVFEIPSGVLADRWGRKNVLLIGAILQGAGFLLIGFGSGLPYYIVGMILYGTALAMVSGADSAFIYDSLKASGREDNFASVEGRAYMYNLLAWGFGGLAGGFLATIALELPFILAGTAALIGFSVLAFAKEPPRSPGQGNTWQQFSKAAKIAAKTRSIRAAIIFSGIIYGLLLLAHKFTQPYLLSADIPLARFGLVYFFWLMTAALASRFSEPIAQKIGRKKLLLLLPLFAGIALLYLGSIQNIGGIFIIPLYQIAWGSLRPQINRIINIEAPSDIRATLLSGSGFVTSVIYITLAPIFGPLADAYDFPLVYLIVGVIIVVAGVVAARYLISTLPLNNRNMNHGKHYV